MLTLKMQVLSLVKTALKFLQKLELTTLLSVTQNAAIISMKQTKISTKKRTLSSAMVWCQSSAVVNRLKLTKLVKL